MAKKKASKGTPRPGRAKPVAGGTPAAPARAPAAVGVSGIVKYPYDKWAEATPPPFAIFGDPAEYMDPFTPDEFAGLVAGFDHEESTPAGFAELATPTPVRFQEVLRDAYRRTAGSRVGDTLNWMQDSGFIPNCERWQIPDPENPGAGENTPAYVQIYCPPGDQIYQLWAPNGDADCEWPNTWRAMVPDGMVTCTGGKLAAGNQRGGLAAAYLTASLVRELCADPVATAKPRRRVAADEDGKLITDPDHLSQLWAYYVGHKARLLG